MASLYRKDNGIYMLAVCFQKERVIRSLGTKSKEEATHAAPSMEKEILREILNGRGRRNIPFNELVGLYLKADHGWKESTKEINTRMLGNYLKRGLPENKTSRALTIRIINGCNRWGKKMKHIDEYIKMEGIETKNPREEAI